MAEGLANRDFQILGKRIIGTQARRRETKRQAPLTQSKVKQLLVVNIPGHMYIQACTTIITSEVDI
jgi:hypothetical protein